MRKLLYFLICCLNFECEIFAGNGGVWESIEALASKKEISIFTHDYNIKMVQAISEEREKGQKLDLTLSMLLYMGDVAYLNGDKMCIGTIWKI